MNRSLNRAVQIVQEIIQNGQPVAVQEAVIIAKDIFRRFPNKYEKIIGDIVTKNEMYVEPEPKAAFVWILGEYAEKIKQVEKLL